MNTPTPRQSATIYQFPLNRVRRSPDYARTGSVRQSGEVLPATRIADHDAWYHQAAVEEDRIRKI